MRKIFILINLFLFLFSFNINANTVKNIAFGSGQIIFEMDGNKVPPIKVDFDDENLMIFIEFENTKPGKNIKEILNVDGTYVKDILKYEYDNNLDFFITLKSGVGFTTKELTNPGKFIFNLSKKKNHTIVIDPGHGGKDPGAVSYGLQEKDIVLKISKYIIDELKEDYNVILTRDSDIFIPLGDRAKIAETNNADLFISTHLNANKNRNAKGVEVYHYSKNANSYAMAIAAFENSVDEKFGIIAKDYTDLIVGDIVYNINMEKSVTLAENVLKNLVENTKFQKRQVLGARFTVLATSKVPAILVEAGFITNRQESKNLNSTWYQKRIANAIAKSVRKYFNE